jgi:hypothetical protein
MVPTTFLSWLGSMSFDVAFILVVLPTILIAIIGTIAVRTIFVGLLTTGSTVGPAKNQVAAEIYAVVLGFIIVYGFSEFNDARQNVLREVATLGRLMAQAPLAGEEAGKAINSAVLGYSQTVATKEWPLMANGGESTEALAWLRKLDTSIISASGVSDGIIKIRLSSMVDEVVARRVDRISSAPDPVLSNIIFHRNGLVPARAQHLRASDIGGAHLQLGDHHDGPVGAAALSIQRSGFDLSKALSVTRGAERGLNLHVWADQFYPALAIHAVPGLLHLQPQRTLFLSLGNND